VSLKLHIRDQSGDNEKTDEIKLFYRT